MIATLPLAQTRAENMLACCWLALCRRLPEALRIEAPTGPNRMAILVTLITALACVAFVLASAVMNATALATFGRTSVEVGLLVTVSLAADAAKAVLPVILARAVLVRAWLHAATSALMLAAVIGLSVFSGLTFVALTKGRSTAAFDAHAVQLTRLRVDLVGVEKRLAALGAPRSSAIIAEELKGLTADRRWPASKSCTDLPPAATSLRQFCAGVFKTRAEAAAAEEQTRLAAERLRLREQVEELERTGVADVDAAPRDLGPLLGLTPSATRTVLSLGLAIVVELGSVVLVLLLAGPALAHWRAESRPVETIVQPAELPPQADRRFWKERGASVLMKKGNGHGQS